MLSNNEEAGDWWSCVKTQLGHANDYFMEALKAAYRRDWDEFKKQMNNVCNVLKDMPNCWA